MNFWMLLARFLFSDIGESGCRASFTIFAIVVFVLSTVIGRSIMSLLSLKLVELGESEDPKSKGAATAKNLVLDYAVLESTLPLCLAL